MKRLLQTTSGLVTGGVMALGLFHAVAQPKPPPPSLIRARRSRKIVLLKPTRHAPPRS